MCMSELWYVCVSEQLVCALWLALYQYLYTSFHVMYYILLSFVVISFLGVFAGGVIVLSIFFVCVAVAAHQKLI